MELKSKQLQFLVYSMLQR